MQPVVAAYDPSGGCLVNHTIIGILLILVLTSGLFAGLFLNSFFSPRRRALTSAITLALALPFAVTVFQSLTFWSSSILIWHLNHLLSAIE